MGIRREPSNHYNMSQNHSSLWQEFARYPLVSGGTMPSLHGGLSMRLVVSLLTAVCFIAAAEASTTGLLRRSPRPRRRPRSPAPSTSSGSRRYFVRSWQATARPRVSGSAAGSSATLIASDVIVLSADPFGSQSPPLGNLGRAFIFATAQARLGWRFGRVCSLAASRGW
jgi:hypothetical protein